MSTGQLWGRPAGSSSQGSASFRNQPSVAWPQAPTLEVIRLLAKHKSISHSTMGSRPPWTNRAWQPALGTSNPGLALASWTQHLPAQAFLGRGGFADVHGHLKVKTPEKLQHKRKPWRPRSQPSVVWSDSPHAWLLSTSASLNFLRHKTECVNTRLPEPGEHRRAVKGP